MIEFRCEELPDGIAIFLVAREPREGLQGLFKTVRRERGLARPQRVQERRDVGGIVLSTHGVYRGFGYLVVERLRAEQSQQDGLRFW